MFKKFRFHINIQFLLAIPRWMAEHPFLGFLFLLFFAFIISGLIFYQYVYLVDENKNSTQVIQTTFQESSFQKLIETWEEREAAFQDARNISRRNIFLPGTPQTPSEEELTEEEN